MTPLPHRLREALEGLDRPRPEARPWPGWAYTDPGLYALEQQRLFEADWFGAASALDLDRPGAWVRVEGEGSWVVMVGADLTVRALRDVCTHRGAQLLEGDGGQLGRLCLVCPYHAWTFDSAGSLLRAPGMPEGFVRRDHGLHTGAATTRGGVIFVRKTGPGPGPPVPPWLAPESLAPLRRARRRTWEVAANWKLLAQNFQESQHFATVHPALESRTPAAQSTSLVGDGWLGGTMTLRDDLETVSRSGKTLGRPFLVPPAHRRLVRDALLFPNVLTSLQPDYLLTYRLHPLGVDRTRVVGEILLHAAAPEDIAALDDLADFWDRTNDEDRQAVEAQQRGLGSGPWVSPGYALGEDGMAAFDRLLARRLLSSITPAEAP